MTILCLIRHGHTAVLGHRLAGKQPDVPLDATGRAELPALADFLAAEPLRAVYSSPLARTLETARAVASPHGLEVEQREALTDIDFGEWAGRSLEELDRDSLFQRFNLHRAGTAPAGGEHPALVQSRMAVELCRLRDVHPDATIAVVGHADPLRAALAFFLGIPLDLARRIELGPASVTRLELTPYDAVLRLCNFVPAHAGPRA